MSENTSLKNNTAMTEAPASWNTKYTSPEGFICQITLHADSGKELLEKSQLVIAHLLQAGCTPGDSFTFRPRSNGSQKAEVGNILANVNVETPAVANGNGSTSAVINGNTNGNGATHICPVHGVEMKRWEKDNKVWYSHKIENGWCTGKSK